MELSPVVINLILDMCGDTLGFVHCKGDIYHGPMVVTRLEEIKYIYMYIYMYIYINIYIYGGFLSHGGTPSYHPFE